jgi:hypothetical protein
MRSGLLQKWGTALPPFRARQELITGMTVNGAVVYPSRPVNPN